MERPAVSARRRQHLIFICIFILLEIIFVWRSFYGFNTADEMYFIGTSERLYRGEKLLIDEWNPTQQLCAFIIHPIYCLIRTLLGSTEGIVMAMRFLYLIYASVITVFLYLRFQRRGFAAYAPAFLFMIFAPFSICAMSYNSIEFGLLPVVLAVLSAKMEHSVPEYILCGILMSFIVLANPYALVLYFAYALICIAATVYGKCRGTETDGMLRFGNFMWMTLGAAVIFIIFVIFTLQRGTLAELAANLPYIINDSEHQSNGLRYKTWRYFYLCFKNYRWMFVGLLPLYAVTLIDRKRYAHGLVYMILASVCVLPYLIYYGFIFEHITVNYQMLPLAFWCLEAYLVTEHRDKRLFSRWYAPAFVFTLIVQYCTNTGIVTISVAFGMCGCVGLIFVSDWLKEWRGRHALRQNETKKISHSAGLAAACVCLMFTAQFSGTFFLRMTYAWGDERVWDLDTRMTRGPLKGVYTTADTADWYEGVLDDIDALELTPDDELMVFGVAPWIYLYAEAGCGNYSTWQVHTGSTVLYDYYALHPEKFPDVIYFAHWYDDFMESELSSLFLDEGYVLVYEGTQNAMMSPERAEEYGG